MKAIVKSYRSLFPFSYQKVIRHLDGIDDKDKQNIRDIAGFEGF